MAWTRGNLCRWLITCLLQEADQEWPNDAREEKKQHCKNPVGKAAKISTWQGIIVSIVKVYSERTNPAPWQALRGVPNNFRFECDWREQIEHITNAGMSYNGTSEVSKQSRSSLRWSFQVGRCWSLSVFHFIHYCSGSEAGALWGLQVLTLGDPQGSVFGVAAPTWRWKHNWGA